MLRASFCLDSGRESALLCTQPTASCDFTAVQLSSDASPSSRRLPEGWASLRVRQPAICRQHR